MLQLLMSPASPFVRKVRVLVREAGAEALVEEINVSTSPLASDPAILAANPIGKIPALLRDDGPAVYDSRVITRYLDTRFRAGLYPEDRIWEVLTIEATADAIMEAAVGMVYELRYRPPQMQFDDWKEAQWAKISRALDALGDRWLGEVSGQVDMGQIAVACALSYLDFRHDARHWRQGRGDLDDWHVTFRERPSMAATRPD